MIAVSQATPTPSLYLGMSSKLAISPRCGWTIDQPARPPGLSAGMYLEARAAVSSRKPLPTSAVRISSSVGTWSRQPSQKVRIDTTSEPGPAIRGPQQEPDTAGVSVLGSARGVTAMPAATQSRTRRDCPNPLRLFIVGCANSGFILRPRLCSAIVRSEAAAPE